MARHVSSLGGAARPRAATRAVGRGVGEAVLIVAAAFGALCILLLILGAFAGVRIVLFGTGSMSPTMPEGTAAIAREIPASEIRVGDVITVGREGRLPVTHRVVSIESVAGSPSARSIVMRGDANPTNDVEPYVIDRAAIILFAVPGVATSIAWLGQPTAIIIISALAAGLVAWSLWPRHPRDEARGSPVGRHRPAQRSRARLGAAVTVALLTGAIIAAPAAAPPVAADEVVEHGEAITLISIGDTHAMRSMSPGAPLVWDLGVVGDPRATGEVHLRFRGAGDAELGLRQSVRVCDQRWVGGSCAGATQTLFDGVVPLGGPAADLLTFPASAQRWFRLEFTIPAMPTDLTATTVVTYEATGSGDFVSVPVLAITGLATADRGLPTFGLVAIGVGVGLGLTAAVMRRRAVRR